jgi:hypothetical protein
MTSREISSFFSENVVRIQTAGYARLSNDSGGDCSATLIWGSENPHGMILVPLYMGQVESWVFATDLLRKGCMSTQRVGKGQVQVYRAGGCVRIEMRAPDGEKWMRVTVVMTDVHRFLSAVDARMLNAPVPDLDAEFAAMLDDRGGASGTWEDEL